MLLKVSINFNDLDYPHQSGCRYFAVLVQNVNDKNKAIAIVKEALAVTEKAMDITLGYDCIETYEDDHGIKHIKESELETAFNEILKEYEFDFDTYDALEKAIFLRNDCGNNIDTFLEMLDIVTQHDLMFNELDDDSDVTYTIDC